MGTWLPHPSVLLLTCIPFHSLHSQCPFHCAHGRHLFPLPPCRSCHPGVGPGLCGTKAGLWPHCHLRPAQNCFFLLDTVNLKPDSVDGSCFLLPRFFRAFQEVRGAFFLGYCPNLQDPAHTQPDLLLQLVYVVSHQGRGTFSFACL